jgi:3-oxoacyl-[acyl-carrier-protein] synthase-3
MSTAVAHITAIGTYAPEKRLTNHDLEKMVDTSHDWIVQRTGIHERRIASKEQFTSDLCIAAVHDLLDRYPVTIHDVDMILVATSTPDFSFPSVASQIQEAFEIERTGALDLSAACAGFVYALQLANALITSGMNRKVLVIGGEVLSKVTDFADRTTCILFGDAAGAVLVERREGEEQSFLYSTNGTDGKGGISLYLSSLSQHMKGKPLAGKGNIVQNGREVYKFAVDTLSKEVPHLLENAGYSIDDLDWFVPHSANLRILESVCRRINFPIEKTLFSGTYYGNTSAATIPLSLQIALEQGRLQKGDLILLSGFGGGLTHSHLLMKWTV